MKVLVSYDTRNGSTTDVAQAIARRLREHGYQVDIQPACNVRTSSNYNAFTAVIPVVWRD